MNKEINFNNKQIVSKMPDTAICYIHCNFKYMEKNFVLLNVDNNKYWTGRYWDIPYSVDIRDAKMFSTEDELIQEISTTEEENYSIRELLNEVRMFDVRVVYVA